MKNFFDISQLESERQRAAKAYLEFLRVPPLSCGIYVLAAGARDNQKPHNQDEIYYVLRGKAKMQLGLREVNVAPGQLIYVAAREEHSFHTIEEELSLLVMFAPAESD